MRYSIQKLVLVLTVLGLAAGCSTLRAPSPADPFEGFNRGVSSFNEGVDTVVLKPLAKGYNAVTAPEVRTVVGNFFSNLEDIAVAFNNLLQGKPKEAGGDISRFALNSTIGIFGLVDVASELGFQKHDEDFGQTLGVWGVGSGPYLVLPLLGPSTLRDASGKVVDAPLNPLRYHDDVSERNSLIFLNLVDKRARLLPATDLVDRVALDKYAFVRDAYLARRASQIRDGAPDPNDKAPSDDGDESSLMMEPHPPFKAALDVFKPLDMNAQTFELPGGLAQSARAKAALGLDASEPAIH
ncbi:MAG TPA: VacJ family lipoprotein [Limnobacter sp.]|uniref:MlaA family lipoprotein n=1 Tax=Limnobacter sp. TaxID=2003368 RepID=UPI002EDBAB7E